MENNKSEEIGLYISVGVTLFMSVLGICFGVGIESDAILLDGFFNVVSFLMAMATLWVAWLQKLPESPRFQVGYISFIPLVNLSKGLLIFTLSLFALFSAISALLHGGRDLNANLAVIYAIIAATGCLLTAFIQKRMAKQTPSPMLQVDAKNWIINGLISLAVGMAFTLAGLMQNTSWNWFVPYADPTIVTILVLVTIYVPIEIAIQSLKQLLLGSPSGEIQKELKIIIQEISQGLAREDYYIRMVQIAQRIYVSIFWVLPPNFPLIDIVELDKLRDKMLASMKKNYPDIILDVIFTKDSKWIQ